MRVNLINSFYTSVFLKKTNVKKINTLKKKKKRNFTWTVQFALFTCSTVQWTVEAWYTVPWTVYHATLFEQCSMVVLKEPRKKAAFFCFQIACVSHAIHCGTHTQWTTFFPQPNTEPVRFWRNATSTSLPNELLDLSPTKLCSRFPRLRLTTFAYLYLRVINTIKI